MQGNRLLGVLVNSRERQTWTVIAMRAAINKLLIHKRYVIPLKIYTNIYKYMNLLESIY